MYQQAQKTKFYDPKTKLNKCFFVFHTSNSIIKLIRFYKLYFMKHLFICTNVFDKIILPTLVR